MPILTYVKVVINSEGLKSKKITTLIHYIKVTFLVIYWMTFEVIFDLMKKLRLHDVDILEKFLKRKGVKQKDVLKF